MIRLISVLAILVVSAGPLLSLAQDGTHFQNQECGVADFNGHTLKVLCRESRSRISGDQRTALVLDWGKRICSSVGKEPYVAAIHNSSFGVQNDVTSRPSLASLIFEPHRKDIQLQALDEELIDLLVERLHQRLGRTAQRCPQAHRAYRRGWREKTCHKRAAKLIRFNCSSMSARHCPMRTLSSPSFAWTSIR